MKKRKTGYPVAAFVISGSLLLLVFSYCELLGNGIYTVLRSDLFQQYVPFIEMFMRVVRGEQSYWYSWNTGLGSNTSLIYAYYTLSPFNLIFLLSRWVDASALMTFIIIVKIGLAACMFQIFISKLLKQERWETIVFGVYYSQCGFVMAYHFNVIWLDAIYILPLIAWLLLRLVEHKKWIGLSAAYAYLFMVHFYTGYIVAMFSLLLFIVYLVCYFQGQQKKEILHRVIRFMAAACFGIGISAVVWLPAAAVLFAGAAGTNAPFQSIKGTFFDICNNLFMGQFQSLEGAYPYIYSGIPVLILLPFYFLNNRFSRKERLCSGGLLLLLICCMLLKPLNMWLHAFDRPDHFGYRYSFCFSFVCILLAGRQLLSRQPVAKKYYILLAGLFVFFYGLMQYLQSFGQIELKSNTFMKLLINILFIVMWMILFYRKENIEKRNTVIFIFALMAFELGINGYIVISQLEHKPHRQDTYQAWYQEEKAYAHELSENDTTFYRSIMENSLCINSAAWTEYRGVNLFTSGINSNVVKSLYHLGVYGQGLQYNYSGMTPFIEMILNIKYHVKKEGYAIAVAGERKEGGVEKNEAVLPVGFMVDQAIKDYHAEELHPFENQNRLVEGMTGTSIRMFSEAGYRIENVNSIISSHEDRTYVKLFSPEVPVGYVNYFVPPREGKEVYGSLRRKGDIKLVPNMSVTTPQKEDRNILMFSSQNLISGLSLNMGLNGQRSEYQFQLVIGEETEQNRREEKYLESYYDSAEFYYFDRSVMENIYQSLSDGSLHVEEYDDGFIKGNVEVKEDKTILFTSIPYEKGWHARVDGIEIPCIGLVEEAFLGIELPAGNHQIELWFGAPGEKEGKIISLCFLAVYLLSIGIRFGDGYVGRAGRSRE